MGRCAAFSLNCRCYKTQKNYISLWKADLWLFDATYNAENLGVQPWPSNGRLTLPAQSVSLYVIGE